MHAHSVPHDLLARRAQRAREGSNRKRDRQALALLTASQTSRRRQLLLRDSIRSRRSVDAWGKTVELLRKSVPETTWRMWFEPLALVGEIRGALHIEGPARVVVWVERRYLSLIGDAVRASRTGFSGVYLSAVDGTERRSG